MIHRLGMTVCALLLVLSAPATAQQRHQEQSRGQGAASTRELIERIEALEAQIRLMRETGEKEDAQDRLKRLLEEAKSGGGESSESSQVNQVFKGEGRQQSQLNPEISVTGDFFGSYSTAESPAIVDPGDFTEGFNYMNLRDVGFHFVAPLDPFTRGKFMLGIPGSGEDPLSAMIDEAYMEWLNLPGGLNLKVGSFFNQFGILNRFHDHGLPQVDRPSVLRYHFGNGNLGMYGFSGNFMLSGLWADVNEIDIEVGTGGDGFTFDDDIKNVFGVVHLKNYYDLTSNTYLEIGFSGAHGYNDESDKLKSTVGGVDITSKWVPAGRSHYRTVEFRAEFLVSRQETATDEVDRFGYYAYITSKRGPKHWFGIRHGYTEIPFTAEKQTEWDISPTLDYWQSEFVMWRLQYSYTSRDYDEDDHSVYLHTVWSMGPHKHEAY